MRSVSGRTCCGVLLSDAVQATHDFTMVQCLRYMTVYICCLEIARPWADFGGFIMKMGRWLSLVCEVNNAMTMACGIVSECIMYEYIMYEYIMYEYVVHEYIMYKYIKHEYTTYEYITYEYAPTL